MEWKQIAENDAYRIATIDFLDAVGTTRYLYENKHNEIDSSDKRDFLHDLYLWIMLHKKYITLIKDAAIISEHNPHWTCWQIPIKNVFPNVVKFVKIWPFESADFEELKNILGEYSDNLEDECEKERRAFKVGYPAYELVDRPYRNGYMNNLSIGYDIIVTFVSDETIQSDHMVWEIKNGVPIAERIEKTTSILFPSIESMDRFCDLQKTNVDHSYFYRSLRIPFVNVEKYYKDAIQGDKDSND